MALRAPIPRTLTGRVLTTTTMAKTVKVRITSPANTTFHPVLRKMVGLRPKTLLVHDPRQSCVEGDVVHVQGGFRVSKAVKHVVTRIVAPFGGVAVEDRQPVLTDEDRANWRTKSILLKYDRRLQKKKEEADETDETERRKTEAEAKVKKRGARRSPQDRSSSPSSGPGASDDRRRESRPALPTGQAV